MCKMYSLNRLRWEIGVSSQTANRLYRTGIITGRNEGQGTVLSPVETLHAGILLSLYADGLPTKILRRVAEKLREGGTCNANTVALTEDITLLINMDKFQELSLTAMGIE